MYLGLMSGVRLGPGSFGHCVTLRKLRGAEFSVSTPGRLIWPLAVPGKLAEAPQSSQGPDVE